MFFEGFFLGGETLRRSLHDIIPPQRKKAFLLQLISTVKSKQSLYLRVCIQTLYSVFVFSCTSVILACAAGGLVCALTG